MAITTYAGIMNGLIQPVYVNKTVLTDTVTATYLNINTWASTVNAGTFNTTAAGVTLSSTSAQVAGQLRHIDPPGGSNSYVAALKALITTGSAGNLVYLCDRLWHGGGYNPNTTSAQTVNSVAWPARDIAGSTNGDGVFIVLEIRASVGVAPTGNVNITYTNQAGTGSRTGNLVIPSTSSSSVNNVYFFGLQSGDTGVRSVQSLTLTNTLISGTIGLAAVRVIALMPVSRNKKAIREDGFTLGLPRLWDGSVPYIILTGNSNGGKCQITYNETIG
jgi:hypothetical protein